jgi:hypothetical protein
MELLNLALSLVQKMSPSGQEYLTFGSVIGYSHGMITFWASAKPWGALK